MLKISICKISLKNTPPHFWGVKDVKYLGTFESLKLYSTWHYILCWHVSNLCIVTTSLLIQLTHCGLVMVLWNLIIMIQIMVCHLSVRCQTINWTITELMSIGPSACLGTNFCEIGIKIHKFSFKEMYFKMSSVNCSHFVLASVF